MFTEVLDSSSLRVGAYGVTAALMMWWGARERRSIDAHRVEFWPTYWFMSAAVLTVMGLTRAVGVAELLGEVGREQTQATGWYEARRTVQASAVGIVAVAWLMTVVLAILRVPPRRRRYLPHVIALSAVVAFAAIRLVSLHQVDALLYRRDIGDVRIVAIVELSLLVLSIIAATFTGRQRRRRPRTATQTDPPRNPVRRTKRATVSNRFEAAGT